MVDSTLAPSQPFHVRSISMPSRDHPLTQRVDEELQKIKPFVAESSLTPHVICDGLKGLGGLYECIEELLHLRLKQKKLMEVELDASVRLLDLLGIMRDCMVTKREQIKDHEMALRRQGEAVAQSKMHAQILSDKKAQKEIKNCFRLLKLKHMDDKYVLSCTGDKESDSWMVIRSLRETREVTISFLQSIFSFLSTPGPKTKSSSRWSLISKALHKRKVSCEDKLEDVGANDGEAETAQYQLQTLQSSIEDIEAGLESLFRRVIKNRVSLLNVLSS
ncbi:hypothetical protein Cni_G21955 [Canna indica]|uniref:Uncharacterized protein n=1 Tax=Canna indica TaxID=4628 RepID=A0AAQ3KQJ0_9LILI|nr:hypothetical protein Cni_G21951 [Canna indica]WOL13186.1 hypothetical protein Cni_G21955 [Canna indica]